MADPIIRRNWKSAVSRHLGTLARLVAEDDAVGVRDRLQAVKASFGQLEAAPDVYHDTLTEEADVVASENWFADVEKTILMVLHLPEPG